MNLLELLHWRYATKEMDATKAVDDAKVHRIVEAVRLAATSSGLQPFEVLVIKNKALREQIKPIAMNQAQVTEASHLLVFAAWDNYTADRINHMFDLTNQIRGKTSEGWENYRKYLLSTYPQRLAEVNHNHAAHQAYIGLGHALIAAAAEGVDATPMEGFVKEQLDQLLQLPQRGLRSVVIMPLGYRHLEKDWLVNLPKIRRPMEQFSTWVE